MAPDNERAWRESVRSARLTLAHLEDPAPALFADFTTPEGTLADFSQPLPLVDFTPFQTLPSDTGEVRNEPQLPPARGAGRHPNTGIERETANTDGPLYGLSGTLHGPGEDPLIPARGDRAHDLRSPAFSFRRAEDPDHPTSRTSRSPAEARDDAARRDTEPDVPIGPLQALASDAARGDRLGGSEPHGLSTVSDSGRLETGSAVALLRAVQPSSLLSSLAEDVLAEARRGERNVVGRRSGSSEPTASGARGVHQQDPVANDGGVMDSLDALTERLLADEAPESRSLPGLPETRDRGAHFLTEEKASAIASPGYAPFVPLNDIEEPDRGRLPVTYPAAGETMDVVSGRGENVHRDAGMGADDYAALVNDALVRQARRHGVDLS